MPSAICRPTLARLWLVRTETKRALRHNPASNPSARHSADGCTWPRPRVGPVPHASVLLDAGESIKALSIYLGHAELGFTLRFYNAPAAQQSGPEPSRD